jgi:hypothetical protein
MGPGLKGQARAVRRNLPAARVHHLDIGCQQGRCGGTRFVGSGCAVVILGVKPVLPAGLPGPNPTAHLVGGWERTYGAVVDTA